MQELKDLDLAEAFKTMHRWPLSTLAATWVGMLLAVFASATYLVWMPQYENMQTLSSDISLSLGKLERDSALLAKQSEIEKQLVEYRQLVPLLQSALPQGKEVPDLLRNIYKEIERNQMSMLIFEPQPTSDTEVLTLVPVKLSAMGAGVPISRLPLIVSELTRKVMLNEFEMVRNAESGAWTLDGNLVAFTQLAPKPEVLPAGVNAASQGAPGTAEGEGLPQGAALTPVKAQSGEMR